MLGDQFHVAGVEHLRHHREARFLARGDEHLQRLLAESLE